MVIYLVVLIFHMLRRFLLHRVNYYFGPLRTKLKALIWRESETSVWIRLVLYDGKKEMQAEVGCGEMEEVSSEIKGPKCHHEKDTIPLYPTEGNHVRIGFLQWK